MKHVMQRIILFCALVVVTSCYVQVVAQPSDYSSDLSFDQVTYITRGDVAPANNAAYTIDRPGVYKLTSAKTASGVPNIVITANNVTLDLGGNTLTGGTNGIEITGTNVVIANGTITGMAQNGVLIQGNGCRVENCDIVSSPTGITLQNAHECVIEKCCLRAMTQAGVSLQSTWTSIVSECEVAGVSGSTSVYGMVAQSGGNNSIEQCMVRAVRTSSSTGTDKAVGIALSGEVASSVRVNDLQAIESLTTVSAYGLWVNSGNNATVINNSVRQVSTSNGRGQGVFVNQANSSVASNLCYDCDSSFTGVPSEFITSQANARGVYNIDTNVTTPDTVAVMHDDQLPTIESQLDLVSDNVFTVDSKLDILAQCESTAVTAAGTLSTDYGLYCLGTSITGQLSITGTGIDLDLSGRFINANSGVNGLVISGDDVLVHNGTVRNASASGVKITGNNCLLDKIVSYGNVTGFELSNADKNSLTNCSAINNTREGYLLSTSDYNTLTNCRAINTSGSGTSVGIKTTGGVSNRFDGCAVNGVASSVGEAYGVLASGEQKTSVVACAMNSVSGQNYTAGVALIGDYLVTPTANDFTYAESRLSRYPEWLNTGVGTYLAISNENSPNNVRIFQFSPTDGLLSATTTQNMGGSCREGTWLSWHNKQYLAMVGNGIAGDDIFIYEFNLATNTLTTITSYSYATTSITVFGCDWFVSGTLAYLAYVVYPNFGSAEELGVLRFDGSTLTKVSSLEYSSTGLLSVKHHVYNGDIRLAVTQHPPLGRPDLIIHSFNEPQGSEALTTSTLGLVSYDLTGGEYIEKCAWFDFDGQTYLTFGIVGVTSTSNVRVLRYTENPTPTISAFASFNYGGPVEDVDALVTGTTVYLAVGGAVAGQRTKILTFDPYAASADRLKSYYNCSADASSTIGVSWNRCPALDNKLFLGVLKSSANPRVYGFTLNNQSQLNMIDDNLVSGVTGGSGLLIDTVVNGVTGNRAYNCLEGLVEGVQTTYPGPQFNESNWQVPHA